MKTISIITLIVLSITISYSYGKNTNPKQPKDTVIAKMFSNLKWRSIGPATTSGRISDFAVDYTNLAHYYVAAAAGHVWETYNNGASFNPIFDNYGVYSIGCIVIDPNDKNILWIGTGENNHQRAIGYGNGVYKTVDGGKTWKNMGLKNSRQIGNILIDPKNSNIVYVAVEGSIWNGSKERGVYKTVDGGKTWKNVLFISEFTGVANLAFDPSNSNIIYAGAEQRQRKTYTKIGGGPESAFYKTTNAGETWDKLTNGIPNVDKGGMAIAVSPVEPNYVYIMFEASNGSGGFYLSKNKGGSFEKMNDYFSSGQYYSEIYASPFNKNKVISVDTYSRFTTDGGKTWNNISTKNRHVDDHAYWADPDNENHFMIGGDGGVYESWDNGTTFIFKSTLPVTQFYRVNVDNSQPFYWIYGGTQDNNSIGGPSQNTTNGGVSNYDWIATLGGDGFFQAIDPTNPNIVYSAYQYGNIYRYDKKSGERIKIKPQPEKGELTFRWNWDAPFILSNHKNTRLYIAANKLFKSDDMGNSWQKISEDLTRNEDRNQFKVMNKYWASDAVAKDVSTSQWGTIVSLSESPVKEGLLYIGTDDGLIQITENNGKTWQKIETFPGIQKYTYVSDVFASQTNENVVFASFNNIKNDDFKPYLLKSSDKGKTWTSISNNLPDSQSVNCIVQDKINENLLFVGTELGIYFTIDGGLNWSKLGTGMPDVSVKDIAIQEREHDIVVATFGRGIYVLDDYTVLQNFKKDDIKKQAHIYPIKDAKMFVKSSDRYGVGETHFLAPNPTFGATFTYFFKDTLKTLKDIRLEKEAKLLKKNLPISQPSENELNKELQEIPAYFVFKIKNEQNEIVRKLFANANTGINKITWNLRYMGTDPVYLDNGKFNAIKNTDDGTLALPGKYSVEMYLVNNGKETKLTDTLSFNINLLKNTTLPALDEKAKNEFYLQVAELWRVMKGANSYINDLKNKSKYIQQSVQNSNNSSIELLNEITLIVRNLDSISVALNGTTPKASWEEVPPAINPLNIRLDEIVEATWESTSAPTETQKNDYNIVNNEVNNLLLAVSNINNKLAKIEQKLDELKIPYTPYRLPIK